MSKLKDLFNNNALREIITYAIFGILTTIVNIVTFMLLDNISVSYSIGTIIAWFVSVLFAFYTNKKYVFKSNNNSKEVITKEVTSFYGSRVLSLLVDLGLMFLFINIIGFSNLLSKIIANIVVVIINYVLSKLFIFKNN